MSAETRFELLLVCALALVACKPQPVSEPQPDLPPMRPPAAHAPPVTVAPAGDGWKPRVRIPVRADPEPARSHGPVAPTASRGPEPPSEARNAVVPVAPGAEPATPPATGAADGDATPEKLGTRWALQASLIQPGCLMTGQVPALALPSPETLAWTLSHQPEPFSGVAREALVCRLVLPRLTSAEVFGASAFRRMALSARGRFAGGKRSLGLIAAAVATDEPRGEGTAVFVMEERSQAWEIRAAAWVPFAGDERTRRLVRIKEARLVGRGRPTIVIRERDRERTWDHYLDLGDTQELRHVLTVPVSVRAPRLRSWTSVIGRRWPRELRWRAVEAAAEAGIAPRWQERTFAPGADARYAVREERSGTLDLPGVEGALSSGSTSLARWVLSKLSKKVRRGADALSLGARIEMAAGKHRAALRLWKKAIRTRGSAPVHRRDYGLYLIARKRKKQARKALLAYLKAAPDAPDASDIRARIQGLGGKR